MTVLADDIVLADCDASRLDDVMRIMADTFDPAFGEAWTLAQCSGILLVPGVWMTLACAPDGAPAGFSIARVVLDEAELLLLGVRPTHRRRGVGGQLLRHFRDTAAWRGATRLHLEMRDGNDAIALYEAAGFQQVGRRPNYYRGAASETSDALTLSCFVPKTTTV